MTLNEAKNTAANAMNDNNAITSISFIVSLGEMVKMEIWIDRDGVCWDHNPHASN
jgi:hypothetical protein